MTKFKYAFLLSFLIFLAACVKDDDKKNDDKNNDEKTEVYIILNEGAYSGNNASLTEYNPETGDVTDKVFSTKNGFPLGDVGQSMTILNDSILWVVVNNSGKIEVMNANTYESITTIEGLVSPRNLLDFDGKTAYLSDLFSPTLTVIDLDNASVAGTISMSSSVESILKYGDNHIIAAAWMGNNKLFKIDVAAGEVVDSLEIAYEPNSMVYDAKGDLYVLCGGGYGGAPYRETPAIVRVNPANMSILGTYPFPSTDHYPSELVYNKKEDKLYFLVGTVGTDDNLGVYSMDILGTGVSATPFLAQGSGMFYTLTLDEEGDLWVTDAGDFSSPGLIHKVDSNGNIEETVNTGIVPRRILKYTK